MSEDRQRTVQLSLRIPRWVGDKASVDSQANNNAAPLLRLVLIAPGRPIPTACLST